MKNDYNKNYLCWWVIQLYSLKFFHLNSFRTSKYALKYIFVEWKKRNSDTRLPSVRKKHSAKELFAECQESALGKELLFKAHFKALNEFKRKGFELQNCVTHQDEQFLL